MTLCLSMIVKNEVPVLKRCIESVRPLIDRWCIVDTGSQDGTQDLCRDLLADVPGHLVERPWIDFATNRTEALALARPLADYALVVDADDAMEIPVGYRLPALDADAYTVDIAFGGLRYRRVQIMRSTVPWRYRGVLHEFPEAPGARPSEHLPLTIRATNDGARRQDPDKYRKDAALLERALETETDAFLRARYTFYLAQSWRDAGNTAGAVLNYRRRAELGFWDEEVFVSWLNIARLSDDLTAYDKAIEAAPRRAEAYHGAANLLRRQSRFAEAQAMAARGIGLAPAADGLFVEPWIYDYGLLDEFAVAAYWSGDYRRGADACDILLSEGKIPAAWRERIVANANFCRRALLT